MKDLDTSDSYKKSSSNFTISASQQSNEVSGEMISKYLPLVRVTGGMYE